MPCMANNNKTPLCLKRRGRDKIQLGNYYFRRNTAQKTGHTQGPEQAITLSGTGWEIQQGGDIIPGESYPKTDNQKQNQGLDRQDDLAALHRYNYIDGGL